MNTDDQDSHDRVRSWTVPIQGSSSSFMLENDHLANGPLLLKNPPLDESAYAITTNIWLDFPDQRLLLYCSPKHEVYSAHSFISNFIYMWICIESSFFGLASIQTEYSKVIDIDAEILS